MRAWQVARGVPRLALGFPGVVAATCEVARMLTDTLGLGTIVSQLFAYEGERWDGKGLPDGVREEESRCRFGSFMSLVMPPSSTYSVTRNSSRRSCEEGGRGIRPIHRALRRGGRGDPRRGFKGVPVGLVLALEPKPWMMLEGEAIDQALAAMGHFSDIAVPHMVGHSAGVSQIGSAAATLLDSILRSWRPSAVPRSSMTSDGLRCPCVSGRRMIR